MFVPLWFCVAFILSLLFWGGTRLLHFWSSVLFSRPLFGSLNRQISPIFSWEKRPFGDKLLCFVCCSWCCSSYDWLSSSCWLCFLLHFLCCFFLSSSSFFLLFYYCRLLFLLFVFLFWGFFLLHFCLFLCLCFFFFFFFSSSPSSFPLIWSRFWVLFVPTWRQPTKIAEPKTFIKNRLFRSVFLVESMSWLWDKETTNANFRSRKGTLIWTIWSPPQQEFYTSSPLLL